MNYESFYVVTVTMKDMNKLEELKSCAFEQFQCDGIEEFALVEKEVDEILGERAFSGGDVSVEIINEVESTTIFKDDNKFKFYFYEDNCKEASDKFMAFVATVNYVESVELENRSAEDWDAEWRKHYKPIIVTENIRIVPEWMKEDNLKGDIYIYPGRGFGTGEHETTFLCLSLFDKVKVEMTSSDLCLDFGAGSGILGIGAVKMCQMKADFVDIDRNALENNLQNIQLNFSDDEVVGCRLILRDRFEMNDSYKLVFANILENALLLEIETITSAVEKDGYLILSGLLNHQAAGIGKTYSETGFTQVETMTKGDWSAILLKKN